MSVKREKKKREKKNYKKSCDFSSLSLPTKSFYFTHPLFSSSLLLLLLLLLLESTCACHTSGIDASAAGLTYQSVSNSPWGRRASIRASSCSGARGEKAQTLECSVPGSKL